MLISFGEGAPVESYIRTIIDVLFIAKETVNDLDTYIYKQQTGYMGLLDYKPKHNEHVIYAVWYDNNITN